MKKSTETTVRLFNDEDDVWNFLETSYLEEPLVPEPFKNPAELLFLVEDEPLKARELMSKAISLWAEEKIAPENVSIAHISHKQAGENWASGWGFPYDDEFLFAVCEQRIRLNIRNYSRGEFIQNIKIDIA